MDGLGVLASAYRLKAVAAPSSSIPFSGGNGPENSDASICQDFPTTSRLLFGRRTSLWSQSRTQAGIRITGRNEFRDRAAQRVWNNKDETISLRRSSPDRDFADHSDFEQEIAEEAESRLRKMPFSAPSACSCSKMSSVAVFCTEPTDLLIAGKNKAGEIRLSRIVAVEKTAIAGTPL